MYEMKTCPQCGQELFSDMDTCFECLFEFSSYDDKVPDDAYDLDALPDDATAALALEPTYGAVGLRVCTASVDVVVPVAHKGLAIGRGSSCDVVLHNPAVSRNHARVEPLGDGVLLCDLGSRNPATVDGGKVKESVHLGVGETFHICDSTFCVCRTSHNN